MTTLPDTLPNQQISSSRSYDQMQIIEDTHKLMESETINRVSPFRNQPLRASCRTADKQTAGLCTSICGGVAWLACCIFSLVTAATVYAAPPNVILLMGDDHGWEEVGYNGHAHVKTPALDQMAAGGMRFDRFYSGHPSCSPTRGSCLTGRHPNRYGTFFPGASLRPEEITIAHLMKKAGYTTAQFGKWHVGPVKAGSPTNPGAMGFDEWLSHDNFFEMNPQLSRNGGKPKQYQGEGSEVVIDEAIRFIGEAQKKDKPFLTVVWFGSPHEPYSGLESDLALYDDLPAELANRTVGLTSNKTGERVRRPLRDVLRERYAEITAMDRSIGKLRNYLKTAGLHQNTIVWYCGDNGTPPSGVAGLSPLRGMKGQVYEGGIRVPGVLEWPGMIKQPRHTSVPAVTSDFLPTLCALTGVEPPSRTLDGINLVPLLEGKMATRPSPICFWMKDRHHGKSEPYIDPELQKGTTPLVKKLANRFTRNFVNQRIFDLTEVDYQGDRSILDDRYKLVIAGRSETATLYDLIKDPGEKNDLSQTKPQLAAKMQRDLRTWQQSVLHSLLGEDYQ